MHGSASGKQAPTKHAVSFIPLLKRDWALRHWDCMQLFRFDNRRPRSPTRSGPYAEGPPVHDVARCCVGAKHNLPPYILSICCGKRVTSDKPPYPPPEKNSMRRGRQDRPYYQGLIAGLYVHSPLKWSSTCGNDFSCATVAVTQDTECPPNKCDSEF